MISECLGIRNSDSNVSLLFIFYAQSTHAIELQRLKTRVRVG